MVLSGSLTAVTLAVTMTVTMTVILAVTLTVTQLALGGPQRQSDGGGRGGGSTDEPLDGG